MLTIYTETQVMMTLAALAATGATERPSGETLADHKARILKGINTQLAMPGLATNKEWKAIWVGLTASRANLAYLAYNQNVGISGIINPIYALVLRGTMGGSPIDTSEDMEVGLMLPFTAGGMPGDGNLGNISQGAMEAFTDILMGTDLLAALKDPVPPTLYVVGHSLGGAMVTTISLYLAAANVLPLQRILPYTFAAPTAGDGNFAAWFHSQFPLAPCVINKYDLVPNAWATLAELPKDHKDNPFYPDGSHHIKGPGPTANPTNSVGILINSVAAGTADNIYVQPNQQPALNDGSSPLFLDPYPIGAQSQVQMFEVQVGFQHANNTYLTLLGAPTLPSSAPIVASVGPTSGPATGGTQVTILPPSGVTFAQDSVVDFGIIPATSSTVAGDGTSITATAPVGVGTVDIRVTNEFGTSPAVPVYPNLTFDNFSDQFTFNPA
ncbi:MAG TPA: hypothetical protein VGM42_13575 [Rhodopila sp.]